MCGFIRYIKGILYAIFIIKPKSDGSEGREESIRVRSLLKEIRILQNQNDRIMEQLEEAWIVNSEHKDKNIEEQILNAVIGFLAPKTETPTQKNLNNFPENPPLESGIKYSEENIRSILSRIPQKYLKGLAQQEYPQFKNLVSKQIVGISDESLRVAYKISKEMTTR